MTSIEAADAIRCGVRSVFPHAEVDIIPAADGGEGTIDTLLYSMEGYIEEIETIDPLGRIIKGRYAVIEESKTAVVETAAASGILLLKPEERNPLVTTTFGTGQIIFKALESGYRKFIIGVGGTSTNDCGTGIAQALGVRFYREDKSEIKEKMCGGLLKEISSMDISGIHPAVQESQITVACDVKNILLGEEGCSLMFSPQKGATSEMACQLEENMKSFIGIAEKLVNRKVRDIPGAGAAGGSGAGLALFLNAELKSGIDIIMDACNFSKRIKNADLILTGEGKIDNQTAYGKVIAGIARRAKSEGIPVIAFAGILENADNLKELGIADYYQINSSPAPDKKFMMRASEFLQETVKIAMQKYKNM
ncbi:MAG: glycerate kinase [Bacteroidetes bacterium]|nr:glycerate kinase [Bacteroidota bacterium]